MNRLALGVLFFAAASLSTASPAIGQLTDTSPHPPTNYNGFVPPAPGQSWADPVFGTQIERLSNAVVTPNNADGGMLTWVMSEYATMSAFNKDRSLFILQHDSYFGLYDGAGSYLHDLPWAVHASSEPRWSRADANVLYFVNGNQLKKHDVASGATTVVRTFGEYQRISGHGESDIGFSNDELALAGDGRYVFVYTIGTNTKGPVLDTSGHSFDSLYLTADGNVLVSYYQGGSSRWNGIELYNRNMVFQRQVARAGGHMDVTRDTNGDEVLVWINAADPAPVCGNGVVKVRLANGNQTCLKSLDWSLAVHISCPDASGWCFVGTYAPGEPDPGIGWPAYTNELLQVKLDGSEVRRLAHHRSRRRNGYNYTPRATVSRDGARLVFSSNFNLQTIQGRPAEYSDAYLIAIAGGAPPPPPPPGGGGGGGGGGNPPPPPPGGGTSRFEQNAASIVYTGSWFTNSSGAHSGGSAALAMDAGSKAKVSFNGTGVRWIGYRDEWSGIARVFVDGTLRATVDTYAAPAQAQQVLFAAENLAAGTHTLEIRVTGNAGGQSGGAWVWIDAVEVLSGGSGGGGGSGSGGGSPPPSGDAPAPSGGEITWIEQGAPQVSYSGAWFSDESAAHTAGSAALAMAAGARVKVRFNGTGIRWIGYRDEWSGIARVYVDGQFRQKVDTYASPAKARQRLFAIEGLRRGEHVLEIRVTGNWSRRSDGGWIWVDVFAAIN